MNSRPDTSNRWASALLALAIYQAFAILWFGIPLLNDFSHSYIGIEGSSDPSGYMWFLTWWPYALSHRLNPFITKLVWAPSGFNVTWAHCIPLPALIAAPITRIWGPVVTWNVLCLMAPALAAWCAFILCRHLSGSFLPALIGGYLFGFSPYMLGHLLGHLSLILIFPVPLAVFLFALALEDRLSRAAFVALFAAVALIQFLCCHELLATAVVMGATVILPTMLLTEPAVRMRLLEVCGLAAIALAIAAALLAPFLYYAFFGEFPRGPINPLDVYSSDLLAFFIPAPTLLIGEPALLASIASRIAGGFAEDTAYIGIPMLLVIADFGISNRRKPQARVLLLALVITALASLGPKLHIAGAPTVTLPWALAARLPLIDKALPGRFMMFAFLDLALITAVYLTTSPHRSRKWFLVVLTLASLIPNLTRGWWFSTLDTPRFFTSGSFRRYLSSGEITLVLPYGSNGNSMLWQAQSGMYFRMPGGFLGLAPAEFGRWPLAESLYSGEPCFDFTGQLKFFLAAHDVGTIVVARDARRTWPGLLAPAHMDSVAVDDVTLYQVPRAWRAAYGGVTAHDAAASAATDAFTAMAAAADAYWAKGLPLQKLTPWEAARLGLLALPPSNTGPAPNAAQWWRNLWLGALGDSTVGIGVVGDYEDLEGVLDRYQRFAGEVFFPFPEKFSPPHSPKRAGQLLLTFDHRGLARAATLAAAPRTR